MTNILRQFTRFVGVGVLATGIQYAVLVVLVELDWLGAVWASGIGFMISATFNYYSNYHFTFESRKSHLEAGPKFIIIAMVGLGLNSVLIWVCARLWGFHYLLAQSVATIGVVCWTFGGNALWSFGESHDAEENKDRFIFIDEPASPAPRSAKQQRRTLKYLSIISGAKSCYCTPQLGWPYRHPAMPGFDC